jgi:cytochrome P450/acyl carrier protein
VQPAFHRQRLDRYADVMVSHAVRTRDRWANGQVVDLVHEMTALALAVVGETLFGEDLAPYERRLGRVLATALASLDPLVALVAPRKRLLPARERLLAIVAEIIARRRRDGRDGDDLLGLLLAAAGDAADDAQLQDDVLTMLLAGHDTIANAMTWTWTCLAEHPEIDARLVREVDAVLGERLPTVKDLPQLGYVRGVLAEALRLRPPAWLLARGAVEPVRLGEVSIPAGAVVLMSAYIVHRDARFFPEPLAFRPERWIDADANPRPRLSYFPFGAGRRSCVGEPFAWMEGVLVLSVLAARWRLDVASQPADVDLRITLRPRGPVAAVPRLRRERAVDVPAAVARSPDIAVRAIVARRAGSLDPATLASDVPLGADGLGFDSVAVVELLLECETAFEVRLPPDLSETGGLTLGRLISIVVAAVESRQARPAAS